MAKIKKRSDCPISSSLDILGDKWSLLIVRDLIFDKECTFGDFLNSDEKIATNILAFRLRTLDEMGIINKSEHPDSKAKVLYKLTPKGMELVPVLVEISVWGGKYFDLSGEHKALQQLIKKDKEGFIKRTQARLREII